MLQVENLVFDYPGKRALKGVSFTLEPGTVTALVGPNGAGKSTLMRLIAALDIPLNGQVLLDGQDVHNDPRQSHRRMGFLPDLFGLYDDLTVERCLLYRARALHVSEERINTAIARTTEQVGLADRRRDKAGTLSRGLRQRLAIGQAIIHEPSLLVLDEPASGLDPAARAELSALLTSLNESGMTILVSSHILSELDDYCSHMLALEEGQILAHERLHAERQGGLVAMTLLLAQVVPDLDSLLRAYPFLSDLTVEGSRAHFAMPGGAEQRAAFLKDLIQRGLPVVEFAAQQKRLQQAYLSHLKESH